MCCLIVNVSQFAPFYFFAVPVSKWCAGVAELVREHSSFAFCFAGLRVLSKVAVC